MNKELWEKAVEYHGHECAGLALGVRLGEEAKQIFGPKVKLYCRMGSRTCITDGITVMLGAEEEEERIEIDPSVSGYLFYDPDDEEGWMFSLNPIDVTKLENPVQSVLSCGRDFLFKFMPWDVEQ